jgi:thiaminase
MNIFYHALDAAYRICYMHVIASNNNPYLNYEEAQKQFQKFIETYENSRYITAVKNWLGIIEKTEENKRRHSKTTNDHTPEIETTKARIMQLEDENRRLKAMLRELQQAIER